MIFSENFGVRVIPHCVRRTSRLVGSSSIFRLMNENIMRLQTPHIVMEYGLQNGAFDYSHFRQTCFKNKNRNSFPTDLSFVQNSRRMVGFWFLNCSKSKTMFFRQNTHESSFTIRDGTPNVFVPATQWPFVRTVTGKLLFDSLLLTFGSHFSPISKCILCTSIARNSTSVLIFTKCSV